MSEKSDPAQTWPFDIWLRLAVLHMHLSPQEFWEMSVRDWFALCHRAVPAQFSKIDLKDLMDDFPDSLEGPNLPEEKDN